MKKIPLQPLPPEQDDPPPAPTAVPEVLEILLLGGGWWFVLIQLPLMRQEALAFPLDALVLLVKVQGIASAAIALVLLAIYGFTARHQWVQPWRSGPLLLGTALTGAMMAWQGMEQLARGDLYFYCAALQAILMLGYFLLQRERNPSA